MSEALLTSNYLRGALSGLGLVNIVAALVELADAFGARVATLPDNDPE